jgi:hypothetical protein
LRRLIPNNFEDELSGSYKAVRRRDLRQALFISALVGFLGRSAGSSKKHPMTSLKVGDLVELRSGTRWLGTVLDMVESRPAVAPRLLAHAAERLHQPPAVTITVTGGDVVIRDRAGFYGRRLRFRLSPRGLAS